MISQNSIEQVLATAKVEEVIDEFVSLKRRGVNMLGLCPFHNEKTPSFTVSPSKNIYKCFGCGKGGNSVQFVMEHESMNFPEAIRFLAGKYQIELEETITEEVDPAEKLKKESYFIITEYAKNYFQKNLMETQEGKTIGLSYFKERGYREATIKKFGLGYALKKGDHFTQTAVEAKYNIESLRALGLTSRSDFDFFRSRAIFPIHNLSGKVIAFAGRTFSTEKKVPKYINSPETDIYTKRKILYAMYHAKTPIRKAQECILVEGYTDVITLHQNGVENVIASSGTSLTVEQIRLVKRYTENIKILFDGDAAGIKAAMRGIDLILEQDMNVQLVLLPDGEDPDSYMKKVGTDAFQKYLVDESEDFIFFKTNRLIDEVGNDPIKKTRMIKDIVDSIAKVRDTLKRSLYIKECSKLLDVDEQILLGESNKSIKAEIKQKRLKEEYYSRQQEQQYEDQFVPSGPDLYQNQQEKLVINDDHQEKDIIRIIMQHGEKQYEKDKEGTVAEYVIQNIKDVFEKFENPQYISIINEVITKINSTEGFRINSFIHHQEETVRKLVTDMQIDPYHYSDWNGKNLYLQTQKMPEENFVNDCRNSILRLKERKIKSIIRDINDRILKEEDDERKILLLKGLQKFQKELSEISTSLGTVVSVNHS